MKFFKVETKTATVYFACQGAAIDAAADVLKGSQATSELTVHECEAGVPTKDEVMDMLNMARTTDNGFAGDAWPWVKSAVVYSEDFGKTRIYASRRISRNGLVVESIK